MSCVERQTVPVDDFEKIFYPRRLAIVGVSPNGMGFGSGMLAALRAIGFEGTIYPVNPRGGEIFGMTLYKSLAEIPESIDFAVIAVRASLVPDMLDACREKGAAGAEILSSGFSETGTNEGIALERAIRECAQRGIRVIGPNCFGVYCPGSGLTLLPGPELSRLSGPVGFISQSGGMSIDFAHLGKWMGVKFSKVISFGNGADLREVELLRYMGDDAETGVITMYVEGVEEGETFFDTLREVTEKKPVILYKGGLSDAGNRAVLSHTASMGGSARIWKSVLRQCNAVQVQGLNEMAQAALAFSCLPGKVYRGISVAGGGGALGVSACDAAEQFGLELPPFEKAISDPIMEILPKPGSSAGNPIDVANPMVPPEVLRQALLHAAKDSRVDLQILVQLLYHYKSVALGLGVESVKDVTPYVALADAMQDVVKTTGKPVILVLPNNKRDRDALDIEDMMREARDIFLEKGIPVFDDLTDALRAVSHVSNYYETKQRRQQGI